MSVRTRRYGLFEAASEPPSEHRLGFTPEATPAQLSWAIIASVGWWVAAGSALLAIAGFATTLVPVWLGHAVDDVIAPALSGAPAGLVWQSLAIALGCLGGLYLVIITTRRLGGRIGWYGAQRAQHELSQQLLERALDYDGQDRLPGELVSRLTADVRRCCQVLYALVYPPGEMVQLLTTVVILWWLHPWLGIATLAGAPLMLIGLHRAARPLEDRIEDELETLGQAAGAASETLLGYRTLRGLHAEHVAADRYASVSRRALSAAVAARSAEARFDGLTDLAGGLFAALLVGIASFLTAGGELSIGQLTSVTGLSITVIGSLGSITEAFTGLWATAQGAGRRILDLAAPSPSPLPDLPSGRLDVGPTGFTVVTGAGDDIRHLAQAVTLSLPGALLAPHAAQLLTGTVMDNVRASGADEDQAETALRRACLNATELADGYDTATGDNGSTLSGGQRQRVALARAIAADPDILILVNPTSSVDAATEQRIAAELREARRGQTTVVISDSPAFRAVATELIRVGS